MSRRYIEALVAILTISIFAAAVAETAEPVESIIEADWQPWDTLPAAEQVGIAPYCPGGFVARDIPARADGSTRFQFDKSTIDDQSAYFSSNVSILGDAVSAQADEASFNNADSTGVLTGNVQLRAADTGISGSQADINLESYYAIVKQAQIVLYQQDLRGEANEIEQTSRQNYTAYGLAFTRCSPDSNAWQIRSSKLTIDNDEGVARAWNSRLEIQRVPVLYIPYISFPLNDQPRTGFLTPTFGSGLAVPYYIHLAPNYDDTLAINYVRNGGFFARNEFRFLTENHNGINQFDYQFIQPESQSNQNTNARYSFDHKQSGQVGLVGYDFTTRWVSDQNFDITLNPGSSNQVEFQTINLTLNNELDGFRNALGWRYAQPVVDSGEVFQSLDTRVSTAKGGFNASLLYQTQTEFDADNSPATESAYELIKQPEAVVGYRHSVDDLGLNLTETVRAGLFARDFTSENLNNLTTSNANLATQTQRYHIGGTAARPFRGDGWYITPSLRATYTNYQLNNDEGYDIVAGQGSDEFNHVTGTLILDQGLTFSETRGDYSHTFKPRLYYAYVPLTDQEAPILEGSFSNNFVLFTPSRFSGIDRVGDMSRLSTGISYDFTSSQAKRDLMSLSAQKGVKLSQERIQLSGIDPVDPNWNPEFSDWIASARLAPTSSVTLSASANISHEWDELTSYSVTADYQPGNAFFAQLSTGKRTEERDDVDRLVHDIQGSAYFPIRENIALITYAKLEVLDDESPRLRDFETAESLIGIDFDACCWNIRLAALNVTVNDENDSTSLFPTNTETSFYFEFTLKGIGGGNGTIEQILNNLDFGYSGKPFNYR